MYHRIHYLAPLLLLLGFASLSAQPKTFHIGTQYVGPETEFFESRVRLVKPVKSFYASDPPVEDSLRFTWLSRRRLRQARRLNLDLIGVQVQSGNVVRDTNMLGNNVVLDVCDAAAAEDLNVCIMDLQLAERFKGERIMLHPESSYDFTERSSTPVTEGSLDNFPLQEIKLSRSILEKDDRPNAIRVTPSMDDVAGLTDKRMQELSVWRVDTLAGRQGVSGLYYLSVIVRRDNDAENRIDPDAGDTATVFHVDIVTNNAAYPHARRVLSFPVREEQFYYGGALHTEPFELALGLVELRQDGALIFVEEGPLVSAWTDTTRVRGETKITQKADSMRLMSRDFDIRVSYGYGFSDATCLLDAICLTNPATYGLMYPDSTQLLAAHRFHRGAMDRRIASILNDEGRRSLFPNLRFVVGPEQIEREGTWRTGKLLQRLINIGSGGVVHTYIATSASTDTTVTGAMHSGFASGFYYYPLLMQHPRPTVPGTDTGAYYRSLNHHSYTGFAEEAISFRKHAEKRASFGATTPWIPYIQNHSNLYETTHPDWSDRIPNREPNAAELRNQCNLALAHGASGVMFYTFASAPWESTVPFWPPDQDAWDADLAMGGRPLDIDQGMLGFLGDYDSLRSCDWNGENKCDSIAAYIKDVLKPIGTVIANGLTWRRSKIWNLNDASSIGGENIHVSKVLSQRQDQPYGIDTSYTTYVTLSEFDGADGHPYLFVLNGRTHPEGHRHITVKLTGLAEGQQWMVTQVRDLLTDGDIHIVRPSATPDSTTVANGFTDYFRPGEAKLYRLEPFADETLDFDGDCLPGSIFIEPAATLRTKATDHLKFPTAEGIFCDGHFYGEMTRFESCDSELSWAGIVARNSGQVTLSNVNMARGGVVTGSGADAMIENSTIQDASIALINYGGTLTSTATSSSGVSRHLSVAESGQTGNPHTFLTRDISSGSAQYGSTAINVAFGDAAIDEIECQNFWRSIRATEGWIDGDVDGFAPSDGLNNSLSSESIGLEIEWAGYIDFGETVSNPTPCARNLIRIDDVNGYHAIAESGSSIAARQNWWDPLDLLAIPDPILIQGTVLYNDVRTDPIPFAPLRGESFASGGKLAKSTAMVPTTSIRDTIRDAVRQRDTAMVRNIAGRFIRSTAAWTAGLPTLRSMHAALRTHGADDLIDSLLTLCLARPDVESKLLAADIATGDSLFLDAIEILDSYSFAGSQPLMARALARKSLIHPLTGPGGYRAGLQALDSLRSMAIATDRFDDYITWYPKLFSGLTQRSGSRTPKLASTQSLLDRVIPSTIEMGQNYPNPFSSVTSFTFKLPDTREIKLTVHDMLGREVTVVKQGVLDRGVHSAVLHAGRLSAGMYLYRLQAGTEVVQGRMVLLR